jgi:hypothetical protein
MSYSRWSNSRWYTFYTAFSGKTKDTQAFEIMIDFARTRIFSYLELKSDIDKCLNEIQTLCSEPAEYSSPEEILGESTPTEGIPNLFDKFIYVNMVSEPDPATVQEMEELKVYMENFIADVEWDYSAPGKLIDYLISVDIKIISRFGWWLKPKIQPKRKKYARSNREV